jgi:hypothetical protein
MRESLSMIDLPVIAVLVVIGAAWAVMASLTVLWVWRAGSRPWNSKHDQELTDEEKRSDIDDD